MVKGTNDLLVAYVALLRKPKLYNIKFQKAKIIIDTLQLYKKSKYTTNLIQYDSLCNVITALHYPQPKSTHVPSVLCSRLFNVVVHILYLFRALQAVHSQTGTERVALFSSRSSRLSWNVHSVFASIFNFILPSSSVRRRVQLSSPRGRRLEISIVLKINRAKYSIAFPGSIHCVLSAPPHQTALPPAELLDVSANRFPPRECFQGNREREKTYRKNRLVFNKRIFWMGECGPPK